LQESRHNSFLALLVGIVGWVLPGSGHLLLRMWSRGLGVLAMVGALAWIGVALRGRLFAFSTGDFFDLLGFLADCGAGSFFYFALQYNNGGPDVAHAAGDYGTRFFAAAGVLNVLAAVDAFRLARGDEHDDEEEPASDGTVPAASVPHPEADPASQSRPDSGATPAPQEASGSVQEPPVPTQEPPLE